MEAPNDTSGFGAPPPVPGGYGGGPGPVAGPDVELGLGGPSAAPPIPGLAVTSLVCGVSGLPLAFCCCAVVAVPLAVVAIVTGGMAIRRSALDPAGNHGRGMAIGGVVGAVLSIALTILMCTLGPLGPDLIRMVGGRF